MVGPGGEQAASQLCRALAEGDSMSPAGGGTGGFHSGHAAPYHQDVLFCKDGQGAEAGFPCGLGIHRAACPPSQLQRADAALVAADAGAYVRQNAPLYLLGIGRVG